MKKHFPLISQKKEDFFRALSALLPQENPEIQSLDGEYIDILWSEDFFLSITPKDTFSVTCEGEFHYFIRSEEMINYLIKHVCKTFQ